MPLLDGGTTVTSVSCVSSLPRKKVKMKEMQSSAIVKALSPLKTHFDMTSGFNMSLCSTFPMQRMTKSALVAISGFNGRIFNTHTSRNL